MAHPLATDAPRATRRNYRAAMAAKRTAEMERNLRRYRTERQESNAADLAAFVARYRSAFRPLVLAVALLTGGVANAAEPVADYLLTLTMVQDGRADVMILDTGLTSTDCAAALAISEPWRTDNGTVFAYGCEIDAGE